MLLPHLSCCWWQVTRQVAQCKCAKRFQVEQIGENKYRVRQRGWKPPKSCSPFPPKEGASPGGCPAWHGGTRGEAETSSPGTGRGGWDVFSQLHPWPQGVP